MRFFILLTILLALVSCESFDPNSMVKPGTPGPQFPEITTSALSTLSLKVKFIDFSVIL